MERETELDQCMKRKNVCEENLRKAHVEIWERYSIGIKCKLESRSHFDGNEFDDPIKLLETMKEHSLSCEEL